MIRWNIFLSALVAVLLFAACQKEELLTDPGAKLTFSADTVSFDTVFTSIGTVTRLFTVKNPGKGKINIARIQLAGGNSSNFRLNINGIPAHEAKDVLLSGGDSLYIFVEATIDPTQQNNPMVIKDSILFQLNGNQQDVKLIAFGQDFHLKTGKRIKSEHWTNDKPYLIYNSLLVEPGETLTIDAGCRIHFHKGSSLLVLGTLVVNGTADKPVYFQGDRLEKVYENVPGQWGAWRQFENGGMYLYGGIHFAVGSKDNRINHAVIRNAHKGIQADSLGASGNPMLTISNTRIENMSSYCLNAHGSNIRAWNCIFANSGYYCLTLLYGGDYEFYHCTMANFFSLGVRNTASLVLSNHASAGNTTYSFDLTRAGFYNCILYGGNTSEILLDKGGTGVFNYTFENCLMKADNATAAGIANSRELIFNVDPKFTNTGKLDYSIDSLSPARNIARYDIAVLYPSDIRGNSRLADGLPDLGAVEWVPAKKK